MKFIAAVLCLLLSLASLFFALDASGSLQDAPPTRAQTMYTIPYTLGFALFGIASIVLFLGSARRGL